VEAVPDDNMAVRFDDEKTSPNALVEALDRGGIAVQGDPTLPPE
jgi:hypothetical protein